MSIRPGKKPSLFAPLADEYDLSDADVDRILARIGAAYAEENGEASSHSSSPDAGAAARSSGARNSLLLLRVGVSCLALAIAGATVFYASWPTPAAVSMPAATPSALLQPEEPARESESTSDIPSISVEALPMVATSCSAGQDAKKVPAATSTSTEVLPAAPSDTLERETLLIAAARQALKLHDGDKALSLLDEHARLFPNGWFANDRIAERIIVLCTLGRQDEATREATVFLNGRPQSPLTRRVEKSCAGQSARKEGQ